MSPTVSVIIPAHNEEETIQYAIASVLEQTMEDLEVIVVDDASTDLTAEIVNGIRDHRVRLVRSEKNIREAAARNLGMRNARGKWIAFLDADDEWVPSRLQHLLEATGGKNNCFVGDIEVLAVPGPSGRLVRAKRPRQPEDGSVQTLDLKGFLNVAYDVRMIVSQESLLTHGISFPDWGSGGEWIFLLSQLVAHGVEGRLVRRVGYLYRAAAEHDCSTLRAREEHLQVLQYLGNDPLLSDSDKDLLLAGLPDTYERLVAASLKERNVSKFLQYASRRPAALLRLPRRTLLFALAKVRVRLANIAASSTGPAVEPGPASANESHQA